MDRLTARFSDRSMGSCLYSWALLVTFNRGLRRYRVAGMGRGDCGDLHFCMSELRSNAITCTAERRRPSIRRPPRPHLQYGPDCYRPNAAGIKRAAIRSRFTWSSVRSAGCVGELRGPHSDRSRDITLPATQRRSRDVGRHWPCRALARLSPMRGSAVRSSTVQCQ